MTKILLFLLIFTPSCFSLEDNIEQRDYPIHTGEVIDPYIKVILGEFFRVSSEKHLIFTKKVTVGIIDIKRDNVIGLCHYRDSFREIDLDKSFWRKSTWESKISLLIHELTHCYCGRDHDYDKDKLYPEPSVVQLINDFFKKGKTNSSDGFFKEDYCPVSIMYPVIVDDACLLAHYSHYIDEIFNRCEPW